MTCPFQNQKRESVIEMSHWAEVIPNKIKKKIKSIILKWIVVLS